MKYEIKLFNFFGIPVKLKIWFFLLFIWLSPSYILAIFISILLHELSHAFVAKMLKYDVSSVKIDFFGGYAEVNLSDIPEKDSIKIVSAGPLINLLVFLLIHHVDLLNQIDFLQSLKKINFILFVFNVLPIYPLDGGRIFRDLLCIFTKNKQISVASSAVVSILLSSFLVYWSLISSSYFLLVFALIFIYFGIKDLRLFS